MYPLPVILSPDDFPKKEQIIGLCQGSYGLEHPSNFSESQPVIASGVAGPEPPADSSDPFAVLDRPGF